MAMHIEQPDSRQSAPAALKISDRPSRLGLALHLVAARRDHQPNAVGDVAVLEGRGGEPEVADPAVRARADEHDVDLLADDRLPGAEVHVLERALERALGRGIRLVVGRRDARGDRDAHAGVRAVGDHRLEGARVDRDRLVVRGAVVGRQLLPARERRVPGRPLRCVRPAVDVLVGRVVRRDEPGPRAALDAHVADRHPLFHRQRADRLAAVLEDVAGPATDADPGQQGEDDVLGAHAWDEPAIDPDFVGLRVALEQGLGGEDHLDLARPDPERQRSEGAVRARMRVPAHDRHARLGQSHLRADDVDDPL